MAEVCFHAVGRRKKAIARVRLIPGEGNIVINKRPIDEYFGLETLKTVSRQPVARPSSPSAKLYQKCSKPRNNVVSGAFVR